MQNSNSIKSNKIWPKFSVHFNLSLLKADAKDVANDNLSRFQVRTISVLFF